MRPVCHGRLGRAGQKSLSGIHLRTRPAVPHGRDGRGTLGSSASSTFWLPLSASGRGLGGGVAAALSATARESRGPRNFERAVVFNPYEARALPSGTRRTCTNLTQERG